MMQVFKPSECLALLTVFSDACKEVELLENIAKRNFPINTATAGVQCGQAKPDTLLTELNKIFFQTLLRYERARREDYLELPDGTFRKLNDDESTKVKYLEIVSRVSKTLQNLLYELDKSGTFSSLGDYCEHEQAELDKLANFVASAAEKEESLTKLQDDIQKLQNDSENEAIEFFSTLKHLKHEFQELREMSAMTLQFKSREYAAKLYHKRNAHDGKLKKLNDELEKVKTIISQASRAGEEVTSWMYSDISDKVNLSELVPQNKLPEQLAHELAELKIQLEERRQTHAQLQQEYETCQDILRVDKREKATRQVRDNYAKKVVLSAVQIQCWWRTVVAVRGIRIRRKRKGKQAQKAKKTNE